MTRLAVAAAGLLLLAACEEATLAEAEQPQSGLPSPARAACMVAVANQTGDGNVAVLSGTASPDETAFVVGVGEDRAPWRCVASSEGAIREVVSITDEGLL